jgi:release factor glutamine methyltransferase
MNVKDALKQASSLVPIDAHVLLAHVLRTTRAALYAFDDRMITSEEKTKWTALLSKRMEGFPVAYLIGEKECMGLMFEVNPDVLIPRPDTELLIETALSLLKPGATVLDIGTGSGVIAISIASHAADCSVLGSDISTAALSVAARNISRHHLKNVSLQQSDLFSSITASFDMIVSNPPYIAANDPHLNSDIRFEPALALVAGEDGLDVFRQLITQAPAHLNAGGWICLEHGYKQAAAVQLLLKEQGFQAISTLIDLAGNDRVTVAHWFGSRC